MKPIEIIQLLHEKNVLLSESRGKLVLDAAKGTLTSEILALIKSNKSELIAFLRKNSVHPITNMQPGINKLKRGGEQSFSLSSSQKRLWFIDQLEDASVEYNMPSTFRVEGEFNLEAANQSIQNIIQRHEPLRTIFSEKNGEPVQIVKTDFDFELQEFDLSQLSANEQSTKIMDLIQRDCQNPFNLSRDLMLRTTYLHLTGEGKSQRGILLFNMHHIASDGWSMAILVKEFVAQYQAIVSGSLEILPSLDIQYADYAEWQNSKLENEAYQNELNYWKKQLEDTAIVHSLPLDYPRPAVKEHAGSIVNGKLNAEASQALQQLSNREKVTPFMLLHAAIALVLSRHSNSQDIVLGTPVANRTQAELEPLIGAFVNTLVLRANTNFDCFRDLLAHVKTINLDALANQEVPFEHIVENCDVIRSTQHSPLFQILLNMDTNETSELSLPGIRFIPFQNDEAVAKFDIEINLQLNSQGLFLDWVFDKSIFKPETIERLNAHLERLLVAIIDNLELPIHQLAMLSGEEIGHLTNRLNKKQADYPKEQLIHELFEAQAKKFPNYTALVFEEQELSYQILNERANQLAHYLREQGVTTGSFVGLCFEPGLASNITILAILKAGGAYVPLDPNYPQARLKYMLEDSGLKYLVSQKGFTSELGLADDVVLIEYDSDSCQQQLSVYPVSNIGRDPQQCSKDLAYVIYTSGSTGQPKGVMVPHLGVVRLVINSDFMELNNHTRFLQAAPISFDAATLELWGPLLNGGCCIVYAGNALDFDALNNTIVSQSINSIWLTAGLFEQWSNTSINAKPLRWILAGGDVINPVAVKQVQAALPDAVLINGYGPTENTTFSCCHHIPRTENFGRSIPIGSAINGTQTYIVSERGSLVPTGCVGELWLGGDGLALGYLNQTELTDERFVGNPFSDDCNDRLYKTGDLVQYLDDDSLVFIGRKDEQVKIRGFRVEPGEVECQLVALESVSSALVLAQDDEVGQKSLVAYILPEHLDTFDINELKQSLLLTLPAYMLPSIFITLTEWPLTSNGKIDRKALPAPDASSMQGEYIAARTETEKALVAIWAKLLNLDSAAISVTANFFALGGHSLMAIKMISKVREQLCFEVNIKSFFLSPEITKLAATIDQEIDTDAQKSIISIVRGHDDLCLSFAQQRFWFIDQLHNGSPEYNMPVAIEVDGEFDIPAAEKAIQNIIQRHEPLRTVFAESKHGPVQIITTDFEFRLEQYDLRSFEQKVQDNKVKALIQEDCNKAFNLSKDLMVRASFLHLSGEERNVRGILLFNMHHIATDGWSMGILIREFITQYQAALEGRPDPLPALEIQYADYAHWQRQLLESGALESQLGYWEKQLEGAPVAHSLPLDMPRPEVKSYRGKTVHNRLPKDFRLLLEQRAKQEGVTPFVFLHAALALVISRHSNSGDIVLGVPIANRTQTVLEPLIGLFINTLVLRVNTEFESFSDYLAHVKATNLDAQANQDIPFENLVELCNVTRNTQHTPLFQIMLNLNNNEMSELNLPGVQFTTTEAEEVAARYDLHLNVNLSECGIELTWTYDTSLFLESTLERLNDHFERVLSEVLNSPKVMLRNIPMLSNQEVHHLTQELNNTQVDYPSDKLIHQLFEEQAKLQPDNTAALSAETQLSFQEIDQKSSRLAAYLMEQGFGVGSRIGLLLPQDGSVLVSMLAILRCGAAYVPLLAGQGEKRIASILSDASIEMVLVHSDLVEQLPLANVDVILMDEAVTDKEWLSEYTFDCPPEISLDSPAYVIYTSGSTGLPKGVEILHRGLLDYCQYAYKNYYKDVEGSLVVTLPAFDITVPSLYLPLITGGYVDFLSDTDPLTQLASRLAEADCQQSWLLRMTPMHVEAILNLLDDGILPNSHVFVIGGEEFAPNTALALQKQFPHSQIYNHYGPTETVVGCSLFDITNNQSSLLDTTPIGRPMDNTELYLLGKNGELVPKGCIGELYIGGHGVAQGYINQTELTDKHFLNNPFNSASASRIYRSGDRARWNENNQLEYFGRIDEQIKIRGYRVELGEIEHQLLNHDFIYSSIVLAKEDLSGHQSLVAYIELKTKNKLDEENLILELKQSLALSLPHYMMPSAFIIMQEWPLTANGKIDKKSLPEFDGQSVQGEYIAPETETEITLTNIWSQLLKIKPEQISATANFFELGGHSLLTVRLIAEIRHQLKQELTVKMIFESPNLQVLAQTLDAGSRAQLRMPVTAIARDSDRLPTSFAQQRLWFIDQLQGGSAEYNMPIALRIKGDFNLPAAEQAIQTIIQRHESLRTIFTKQDGAPIQIIQPSFEFALKVHDLSQLEDTAQKEKANALIQADSIQAFDLSKDLMVRAAYLQLSTATENPQGILLFNMHHIASDGWSLDILVNEFIVQYQAALEGKSDPLPALDIQYADYAYWQRQWLEGDVLETQLSYWKEQLKDVPAVHGLPLDKPRPEMKTYAGEVITRDFSPQLSQGIMQRAQAEGVTPFMLLHAVLALVLSRHSNSHDIVIGTPVANRSQKELEPLIGFFLNTLVLRTNTQHDSLSDYLGHVKAVNLDAQANQDVSFEHLVEHCQVTRSTQYTPLFQILLNMNSAKDRALTIPGLQITAESGGDEVAKYDLVINATETDEGLSFSWIFDRSIFSLPHMQQLSEHFERLLGHIINSGEVQLSDLDMLSAEETHHLVHEVNATHVDSPEDKRLHELFESQATLTPDNVALIFENETMSYDELNDKANRLAHYLVEAGITPGTHVGVYLERSFELLIAVLAVMKSGGVYVALEPGYPQNRLSYMIDDGALELILLSSHLMEELPLQGVDVLLMDDACQTDWLDEFAAENLNIPVQSSDPIYTLYTSGSTGQPKGVQVTHGGVVNYLQHAQTHYLTEDVVGSVVSSPLCFDATVTTLFTPLCVGKSVTLLVDNDEVLEELSARLFQSEQALLFKITPAHLDALEHHPLANEMSDVAHQIVVGGEQWTLASLRVWKGKLLPSACFVNEYGPTETVVGCSSFSVSEQAELEQLTGYAVPIGDAVQNVQLYVLNKQQQLQPAQSIGELYIGGDGVAKGYLNRAELTQERFVQSPFSDGTNDRLYRTGDLVRYLPDDNGVPSQLEFIGRCDDQVKIRGFRIELGEIEYQLSNHPLVQSSVVLAKQDESGQNTLQAYVEVDDNELEAGALIGELQQSLINNLPEYMLPATFVIVDEWPLTTNGKIDKKILLEQNGSASHGEYVAPETETEKDLVAIWAKVLKLDESTLSVNANFFKSGGHSLLAIRVISEIRQALGYELSVKALFSAPEVRSLAAYIDEGAVAKVKSEIIAIERTSNRLPLSFAQQRLWFIDQMGKGSAEYNMPVAFQIKGDFNVQAAEQALTNIIQRHEPLRTIFAEEEQGPVQVIQSSFEFKLTQHDLRKLDRNEQQVEARALIIKDRTHLFDLSKDLMVRVSYVHLSAEDEQQQGILLFNMHHIASDGWSIGLLVKEFISQYEAIQFEQPDPFAPLEIQYADYASWQREWLESEALEGQLNYWKKQLEDIPAVHALPLDFPRSDAQMHDGAAVSGKLSKQVSQNLQQVAQAEGVTPFMLLHAVLALVLSRHSNSQEMVIGTPVANRMQAALEPMIGFFVNTLVLRTQGEQETFKEYLAHVKSVNLDAQANQDVPFDYLVEHCDVMRSTQHAPLFQILFTINNNESNELKIPGLGFSPIESDEYVAKFDMDISASVTEDGIEFTWVYDTSLFKSATVERLNQHFERMLTEVSKAPELPLQQLPMLSDTEIHHLVHQLNDTQVDYPADKLIHEVFEECVEKFSNNTAVVFEDKQLTYKALNEKSNQLARYLRGKGISTESLVGVCVEPCLELFVAILGILKSGGAYVPLDPTYPSERLEFMLDDSEMDLLITHSDLEGIFESREKLELILLDSKDIQSAIKKRSVNNLKPVHGQASDNSAYVLFTSGSTGIPKGVIVENSGVINMATYQRKRFNITQTSRVLQFASPSFDASVWEWSMALLNGATLNICGKDTKQEPKLFEEMLVKKAITHMTLPPVFLELLNPTKAYSLECIIVAGESCGENLVRSWASKAKFFNAYGPTETTVCASIAHLSAGEPISIGVANDNMQLYVLDKNQCILPSGVIGELYVGGTGLAKGYLNRAELTQERFVQSPFSDDTNDRLYRTGDLVRYLPDDNGVPSQLEFIGRCDDQVKIRGFRIELGEIEYQLSNHPLVQSSVVLAKQDESGQNTLQAYVEVDDNELEAGALIGELQQSLINNLPEYMLPATFVIVDEWPLTTNGKIDKKILLEQNGSASHGEYVAPETETEQALVAIWAKVLKLDESTLSVNANFFKSGGHSLLAIRVISEIRQALGYELSVKALFSAPEVRSLAAYIDEGAVAKVKSEIIAIERTSNRLPLSFAQQRLWFIDQMGKGSAEYNMPVAFQIKGDFNVQAAEQALTNIIQRHEPLRTIFAEEEQGPVQVIQSSFEFKLTQHDLRKFDRNEQQVEARALIIKDRTHLFDLSKDLMVRVSYVHLSAEDEQQQGILLFNMHHIASDGWSIGLLVKEFISQYEAIQFEQPDPFAPLEIQYADYASWQREWLESEALEGQLNYWKKQLEDIPAVHALPLDFPRSDAQMHDGAAVSGKLSKQVSQNLQQVAQAEGVTPFMLLHAVLALVLSRHSNSQEMVIGTPVANRMQAALEPMIGFFVNTLVLRTQGEQETFKEYLAHVKSVNLDAQANQDVPFDYLVEHCDVMRSTQHAPLFQILFTINNNESNELKIPGLVFSPIESDEYVAKFDMDISASVTEDGIEFTWVYDTSLFKSATVERLNQHFERMLTEVSKAPELPLQQLPMLSDTEIHHLVHQLNDTQVDYPADKLIHEVFEECVENLPNNVALIFEEQKVTYAELNSAANRLAYFLRERGVTSETLVGLLIERSIDMVVAILGVLKAGCAYVPLDPAYPTARLQYMLDDTEIKYLLTQEKLGEELNINDDVEVVRLDSNAYQQNIVDYPNVNLERLTEQSSKNLVYVIYTSGSTGEPKGVMVEHCSVVNVITDNAQRFEVTANSHLLHNLSMSFDAASKALWMALCNGACLSILEIKNLIGEELENYINCAGVTHLMMPASILDLVRPQNLNNVTNVMTGGEACSEMVANEWSEYFSFYNAYGPTETTMCNIFKKISKEDRSLLGTPMNNNQFYLLDKHQNLVAKGAVGELYIGGVGVARGYLNREALTQERFINNPFSERVTERLYKTGDLFRYLPESVDGVNNLAFMGRIDDQVKFRGFRIELGEIEVEIARQANITGSIVVLREDKPGVKQLVAYVQVQDTTETLDVNELRSKLKNSLPQHMLPSVYVIMQEWPLTPNGKVDRNSLPVPDAIELQGEFVAVETETEKCLVKIWAKLLELEENAISTTANFFELGGHSLLTVRLIAEIRSQFNQEIDISEIFETSEIRSLATLIDSGVNKTMRRSVTAIDRSEVELKPSFAQKRLWFVDQLQNGSAEYNLMRALRVEGDFNVEAAEAAIRNIIHRHEPLRTVFVAGDDGPIQKIRNEFEFSIRQFDYRKLSASEQESKVNSLIKEESNRTFDLSADLMVRACYLRLSEDNIEYGMVVFNMHHIAFDGWSMGILVREFIEQYDAVIENRTFVQEPLKVQYADYAYWQRKWLEGDILENQLNYWKEQLRDIEAVHSLPLDYPRPAMKSYDGAIVRGQLGAKSSHRLRQLANDENVTPFMLMHAVVALVLSRHSNSHDIVLGTSIANRMQVELEPLIGFFVNTLVFRVNTKQQTFRDLLTHVKETNLGVQANQDISFEHLVEHCQVVRSTQHTPLFQIMLDMDTNSSSDLALSGVHFSGVERSEVVAKFDLEINVLLSDEGLELCWIYDKSLFKPETISRLNTHVETVLKEVLREPVQTLSEIPMLSMEEKQHLIQRLNTTRHDYPNDMLIHQFIEAQAKQVPGKVALVFDGEELTYQALNEASNQLAHYLLEQGVKPNCLVGLCVERSFEMVIGIVGILKAGGAYVPIDPFYPQARIDYLIEDSGIELVLTQRDLMSNLSFDDLTVMPIDSEMRELLLNDYSRENIDSAELGYSSSQLAYVIYTSGSTGQPKGVMVTHKNVVNYVFFSQQTYMPDYIEGSVVSTTLSFDATVASLFPPLFCGRFVKLLPDNEQMLAALEQSLLQETSSLLFKLTPAHLDAIAGKESLRKNSESQHVIVIGGEQLLESTLLKWKHELLTASSFINEYGPTETTVGCAIYHADQQNEFSNDLTGAIPIGRATENTKLYVLDEQQTLVPKGAVGELYIGGEGVANGYHNREELTRQRFVDDPFSESSFDRLYKTGDLVRHLPDDNLLFIGRVDEQVKINGFRIELGEIEHQLSALEQVASAIVLVREDEPGNKRIVAYIIPAEEEVEDKGKYTADLRQSLLTSLPNYMLPSAYVLMADWPLSMNGKVDKKLFPKPNGTILGEYVAPATETEKALVAIWSKLLKLKPEAISVLSNFFELGGDSILSIQAVSRAKQLNLHFNVSDLFEYQTIAKLAEQIDLQTQSLAPQNAIEGGFELLAVQRELLIKKSKDPEVDVQSVLLEVSEIIERENLSQLVESLYQRHDALRIRFKQDVSEVVASHHQFDHLMLESSVGYHDLSEIELSAQRTKAEALIQKSKTSLDIVDGPLFKVVYINYGRDKTQLLILAHRLIVDERSWEILLTDLKLGWQQILLEQPIKLAAKGSSAQQWGEAIKSYADSLELKSERDYWTSQLKKAAGQLPNRQIVENSPSGNNHQCHFALEQKQTQLLLGESNQAYRTEVEELILAALLRAWQEWADEEVMRVELTRQGRGGIFEHLNIEQTVGNFNIVFPLILSVDKNATERRLIKTVKEQCRALPNSGVGYGILKYTTRDKDVLALEAKQVKSVLRFNYQQENDEPFVSDNNFKTVRNLNLNDKADNNSTISVSAIIRKGSLQVTITAGQQCRLVEPLLNGIKQSLVYILEDCQQRNFQKTLLANNYSQNDNDKSVKASLEL